MGLFPIRPAWITYLRQSSLSLPNSHLLNGKAVAVGQQAVEVSLGVAEVGAYAAQAATAFSTLYQPSKPSLEWLSSSHTWKG